MIWNLLQQNLFESQKMFTPMFDHNLCDWWSRVLKIKKKLAVLNRQTFLPRNLEQPSFFVEKNFTMQPKKKTEKFILCSNVLDTIIVNIIFFWLNSKKLGNSNKSFCKNIKFFCKFLTVLFSSWFNIMGYSN